MQLHLVIDSDYILFSVLLVMVESNDGKLSCFVWPSLKITLCFLDKTFRFHSNM
jgi:hypothetical protein